MPFGTQNCLSIEIGIPWGAGALGDPSRVSVHPRVGEEQTHGRGAQILKRREEIKKQTT